MAGGSYDFHTTLESRVIGLGADKGRQEGMMDVDNPIGISIDELFRNDLHVACQHDEVHPMFGQHLHLALLLLLLRLLRDGKQIERDAKPLGNVLQIRMIADDKRHLDIPFACRIACRSNRQCDIFDTKMAIRGVMSEKYKRKYMPYFCAYNVSK